MPHTLEMKNKSVIQQRNTIYSNYSCLQNTYEKNPREIKNPIYSLTGEQLEKPHTTTKCLYWSPRFCSSKKRAIASLKFSLEPWKVQKENERKLKCQCSWTSRFPLLLKTEDRGKPWIPVLTITQVLGLFSRGESPHMLQFIDLSQGKVWMQSGKAFPGLCRGCSHSLASHHIKLLARDGPQKGHKNWQGRHLTWSKEVETSTSQWEIHHIKNVCLMCVHEYTAVPALTPISVHISLINTFPLQTFHPFPL